MGRWLNRERGGIRLLRAVSPRLSAAFAACDLLAQPSVEESFGLVLIEAWMMGRLGRAKVPAKYTTTAMVDAWEAVLLHAARQRG